MKKLSSNKASKILKIISLLEKMPSKRINEFLEECKKKQNDKKTIKNS